ncbi:MAG: hypothetical protein ACXADH_11130 [Candidatus Kariarchaeaceae archaeon]|jgi:hypothetical protein
MLNQLKSQLSHQGLSDLQTILYLDNNYFDMHHFDQIDYSYFTKATGSFRVNTGAEWLTSFSICSVSGCDQIAISFDAVVSWQFRDRGIGTILHQWRLKILKQWGFKMVICTALSTNTVQQKILHGNGWLGANSIDHSTHSIDLFTKIL